MTQAGAGGEAALTHVIVFTGDVAGLRGFYEKTAGLEVSREGLGWVELRVGGCALWLHALGPRHRHEIAIALRIADLEAAITALRAGGADVGERDNDPLFGRVAWVRDPDGRLVDLHGSSAAGEAGPAVAALDLVLGCPDLAATRAFYCDRLRLPARVDEPEEVVLDTGAAALELRPAGAGAPRGPGSTTLAFTGAGNATAYARALARRGLELGRGARDRGRSVDAGRAADPDGNPLLFRGRVAAPARAAAKPRARGGARSRPAAKPRTRGGARSRPAAKPRARPAARPRARKRATPARRRLKR
jgi:catechol 2,3-dioxygenase-like lactoylglutathione lyase family enzyme